MIDRVRWKRKEEIEREAERDEPVSCEEHFGEPSCLYIYRSEFGGCQWGASGFEQEVILA